MNSNIEGVNLMDNNTLNPLIDDATPRGTSSNCADVLQVLQAVDLKEAPSEFGFFLLLRSVESAVRHAQATIETESMGAD